ncbi:MAG: hypothetical protein IJ796_01045 [Lachnospiraceae bacterium]|nr:hypothetical protein [Lachnospiraceae bacterium]
MALRIIYTICFIALCAIDQFSGSLTGRVQFVTTNLTGVVMAVIILSAYDIKSFKKPVYAIWAGICLVGAPIAVVTGLKVYPYKGQWISGVLNVCIYGFIAIRVLLEMVSRRRAEKAGGLSSGVRWSVFILWSGMLILMLASRNESIWPLWFLFMFGSFYLTDYGPERLKKLYLGAIDGVIISFFIIQGLALLFRPYDEARYLGMYLNPNINALFYTMSYCALLCKWFILKKENKILILRILCGLFGAAMYGFGVLTGCKSALLAMIAVTVVFLICILRYEKKKIIAFFRISVFIAVVAVVSVPITYGAVRYMPTIHLHPIYFEGEYADWKVLPGEPRDSEKYISFDEMVSTNLGRIFLFWKPVGESAGSLIPGSEVIAAQETTLDTESYTDSGKGQLGEAEQPGYLYKGEGIPDSFTIRKLIYGYYIPKLNLLGHSNSDDGVDILEFYRAPHAHNFLIQFAFSFGIPAALFTIAMVLTCAVHFFKLLKRNRDEFACIMGTFVTAFVVFGMLEYDWRLGQFSFFAFFFFFKTAVNREGQELTQKTD